MTKNVKHRYLITISELGIDKKDTELKLTTDDLTEEE